jgi:hypothetical protein
MRIGWTCDEADWTVSPAVRGAVERSVAHLEGLGATVVGEIPQRLDEALAVTRRYWARVRSELPGDDSQRHLVDWDRYRAACWRRTVRSTR